MSQTVGQVTPRPLPHQKLSLGARSLCHNIKPPVDNSQVTVTEASVRQAVVAV